MDWWLALKSHPRHISRDIVSRDVEGTGKTRAMRTACAPIAARHGPRSCSCGVVRCGVCVCAAGTEEQRRSKIGTHRALMCRGERGRRAWRRIMGVRDEVTTHHDEVTTHLKTVASNHRRFAPAAARARSSEPAAASTATAAAQRYARRDGTDDASRATRGRSEATPLLAAVCHRNLWVCLRSRRRYRLEGPCRLPSPRTHSAADSWRRRRARARAGRDSRAAALHNPSR